MSYCIRPLQSQSPKGKKKTGFDFVQVTKLGVCAEREESQDKTVLSIHTWSGFSSGAEYYTSKEPFQPLTLYRAVLPQVPRSSSTFLHSSTGKFLGLHLPFCLTFSRSVGGLVRHVKLYTFYINHQLEHPPVSNSKPWPIGPSEVHEEVSISSAC
jgi:hypothetical protein